MANCVKYLNVKKGGKEYTTVEKVAPRTIETTDELARANLALMHYSYIHVAETCEDSAKKCDSKKCAAETPEEVEAWNTESELYRRLAKKARDTDSTLGYTPEDVASWNSDALLKIMCTTFKLRKPEKITGFETMYTSLKNCISADTDENKTAKERSALYADCVEKMKKLFDGVCGEGVVKVTYKAFKNLKATTWHGIKTSGEYYAYNDVKKNAALKWVYDYAFMAIQPEK